MLFQSISERESGGQLARKCSQPGGSSREFQSRHEPRLDWGGLHWCPSARLPTGRDLHAIILPEGDTKTSVEEG